MTRHPPRSPQTDTPFPITTLFRSGFFKREGRRTGKETLISLRIDHPIRPLFPDGFRNEVQIIATVMSMNPEVDGDVLALIGASAALSLSGAPFGDRKSTRLNSSH